MITNVSLLANHMQPKLTGFVSKIANMSIGDNVRKLRKERAWTQEDLARRINISRGRIAQIEKDPTSDVKAETLLSLAKAFGCLPDHLSHGWRTPQKPATQFIDVPLLDVELAGGGEAAAHFDREQATDWVPISQDLIYDNQLSENTLVVVRVTGDSMLPRLQDKDMLLVDTADKTPVSGKIYAIATDDDLRVKRLIKRMDGSWIISSDNKVDPAYQDETISTHNFEQLRIIGRAVRVLMGEL